MKNTFKQYNNIFGHPETATNLPLMEFHVSRRLRKQCGFDKRLFALVVSFESISTFNLDQFRAVAREISGCIILPPFLNYYSIYLRKFQSLVVYGGQ